MTVRACMRTCVCVCDRVCACVCMCIRACVWVCVCMCACVYVRREGRKKKFGEDLPGFCGSVVCAECIPRVHN